VGMSRGKQRKGENAVPAEARAQKGIDPVPWLFALYFFVVSGAAMAIGAHDAALAHANLGVTLPARSCSRSASSSSSRRASC
jgi:hypothetical protein